MPTPNPTLTATDAAPQVLVLLATFNGGRWLDDLLDSVFGQQQVRVAMLASDDGSTDDSVARLQRRSNGAQALQVLPAGDRNLGAAGNFLRLLRDAQIDGHDFVALADQDDIWAPVRLTRALSQLHDNAACGYSSDVIAFWPDGQRRRLGKASAQRAFDHLFEPAGPGCTYVLTAALAKTLQQELRLQPQRFEGIGYHDWLIYAFARTHGFRWVIDETPGVLYRQHDQNELGANFGLAGIRRRWGRLSSGWFRHQVLQIAGLWPGEHGPLADRLRRLAWRDRFWLAWQARLCRRRRRDQVALAVMLLLRVLR